MSSRADTDASTAAAGRSRAVELAARWIEDGRRLEMQPLADELGISRVTLFRHVGGRDELLGQALWLLTEQTLQLAAQRWQAERPPGALHVVGAGRHMNELVSRSGVVRRLLEDEPALAIRILTDPRGQVQSGVVAFVEGLLRRDVAEHRLRLVVEPRDLAFALVRLGESFLYADVLAARQPDLDTANRLQEALLTSVALRVTELPQVR